MVEPTTVALISAATAWAWKSYGKEIALEVATSLTGPARKRWDAWQQAKQWETASNAYREEIRYHYGRTRILGQNEDIPLEGIFTDVYILDKPTAIHRFDIETLKENFPTRFDRHHNVERHHGIELIGKPKGQRLFILGKPGAGKSTFLRYVAVQAVDEQIDKVPIFISLNDWSRTGLDLMAYIVKRFDICKFPDAQPFIEALLQAGKLILLLDGLDEVRHEDGLRSSIIQQIKDFSDKYRKNQFLVTCRIAANEVAFEKYQTVEIADFSKSQIDTYVKKWFQDSVVEPEFFFKQFYSKENEGLRELASIPLLLSLLCLAFASNLTFPRRRAELYTDAIDALLRRWDASRGIQRDYQNLSLMLKQGLFAHIAADTFEDGEIFIPQSSLEKQIVAYLNRLPDTDIGQNIDGRAVLKAIEAQHSIFVERAMGIYSFSHLTFQEYFTAKYIADNEIEGTTKRLIDQHITDGSWREVFLLTTSLLHKADHFFGLFKSKIDSLIADDTIIIDLLGQTEELEAAKNEYSGLVNRSTYLRSILTLALDRALDRARDLDRARTLAGEGDQINKLISYLEASRLYLDCLQLASVSDRAALEDAVLRPPSGTSHRT